MLLRRLFWGLVSRLEGLLWREVVFRSLKAPSIAMVDADVEAYNIELRGGDFLFQTGGSRGRASTLSDPTRTPQAIVPPAPRFLPRRRFDSEPSHCATSWVHDTDQFRQTLHKSLCSRPLLAPTLLSLLYDADSHPGLPCLRAPLPSIETHPHVSEELLAIAAQGSARTRQRLADAAARYRLRWESCFYKAASSGVPQIVVSGWPWTTDFVQAPHKNRSVLRGEGPSHFSLVTLLYQIGLLASPSTPPSHDALRAIHIARAVVFQHSFLDVIGQVCISTNTALTVLGRIQHPNAFTKHSTLPRLESFRPRCRFTLRREKPPLRVILCIGAPFIHGFEISCDLPRPLAWPLLCDRRRNSAVVSSGGHEESFNSSNTKVSTRSDVRRDRDRVSCEKVRDQYQKALRRGPPIDCGLRDSFSTLLLNCKFDPSSVVGLTEQPGHEYVFIGSIRLFHCHLMRVLPIDVVLNGSSEGWTSTGWEAEFPGGMKRGRLLSIPFWPDPRWPIFLSSLLCYIVSWSSFYQRPSLSSPPSGVGR
eukprot:Protomagalhaensia_sp_Gyna_25__5533@NODE_748_length_2699_cov_13_023684_g586_i0_p1_GENE_NODE_748_length_2699_cov_13_023684_g586_i0NODE_748_length_2699_cov_13_023684_g586_i0_p1_ORF_typecomplete_len533_score13_48_NODE_748_length_2699_cov_13_023684_g586_i09652563